MNPATHDHSAGEGSSGVVGARSGGSRDARCRHGSDGDPRFQRKNPLGLRPDDEGNVWCAMGPVPLPSAEPTGKPSVRAEVECNPANAMSPLIGMER